MATAPKIPPEQTSLADQAEAHMDDPTMSDRRDRRTEAATGQPGDSDVNLDQQGRFGNLKQNLTTHWKVQDR